MVSTERRQSITQLVNANSFPALLLRINKLQPGFTLQIWYHLAAQARPLTEQLQKPHAL